MIWAGGGWKYMMKSWDKCLFGGKSSMEMFNTELLCSKAVRLKLV